MNIKKKFESIDQSQLSESQKGILAKIEEATKGFTITDEKSIEKVDTALDNIISKLEKTNPQAIKGEVKEVKPKREVTKKPTKSKTKTPKEPKKEAKGKRTIFSIAKEIRKADESWDEAKNRAKKIMEDEKKDTTKKMKTETDKLLAFIKRRKELDGLSGTSVKKDSKIEALPKGRRVSKKGWKNQHGESEGGKVYYENRDNRTDRLAPNFEDKIYLADGGAISLWKSEPNNKPEKLKTFKSLRAYNTYMNKNRKLFSDEHFKNGTGFYGFESNVTQKEVESSIKNLYADGGTIIGTPETPLGRDLGIDYTGLVGETGAMSSGEMFAGGGATKNFEYVPYQFIYRELDDPNFTPEIYSPEAVKEFIEDFNNDMETEYENWEDFNKGEENRNFQPMMIKQRKFAEGGQIEYEIEYKDSDGDEYSESFKTLEEANAEITRLQKAGFKITDKMKHKVVDGYGTFIGRFADGGTIIGTPETPLGRDLGIDYTGLVGETGAMSSGEMFEQGGSLVDGYLTDPNFGDFQAGVYEMGGNTGLPAGAEQSYVNYYLNEGATAGMYKKGGAIPNNYEGRTPEDIWNSLSKKQRGHFLYDHVSEIEEYKNIEVLPTSEIRKAYSSEWSSLDKDIKNRFANHTREGQYAYGGKAKSRPSMRELHIEQIASLTGTRSVGVQKFADDNNLTDSELSNLMTGVGRGMIKRSDFVTALVGNKNNPKQKEVVAFAKSDKAYKMADGGVIGKEMTFNRHGEEAKGIIGEVNEDGSYNVATKYSSILVEPQDVIAINDAPKKKRFFFDEGGNVIDAFQMRTVRGVDTKPTEILTTDQKVEFAKGGSIKNEDIKVGEEFWLANGDVIEIVRLFKENIDEDWVEYKRNGEKKENSVKELRLFINRLSGKKQKSWRERRNEYLERLGQKEADVWDKIGAESGSEIRNSDKMLKAYAEGVQEMLQKEEVGKGSFDQEDYDFYTDENWHLFNEFLVWNGYYEPEMTKTEKAWREKRYADPKFRNYVSNPSIISLSGGSKSKSDKYIAKADIKEVWVKMDDGTQFTFKGNDVLNGVNVLEKGSLLKNNAKYVAKRNIMYVVLKNGEEVKPANGYWIKKDAKGELFKPEYKGKIQQIKNMIIITDANNNEYVYGGNGSNKLGYLVPYIDVYGRSKKYWEHHRIPKETWINIDKIKDFSIYPISKSDFEKLAEDNEKEIEEIVLKFKNSFEDGGKTTFKQKATAIAKNFEGKKVEPKYQKEYGKTYDKAEAKEVGNKIAGSQKAKYETKMKKGGGIKKTGGAMVLAKQIRKEGESWQSALKRANEQVRNK